MTLEELYKKIIDSDELKKSFIKTQQSKETFAA